MRNLHFYAKPQHAVHSRQVASSPDERLAWYGLSVPDHRRRFVPDMATYAVTLINRKSTIPPMNMTEAPAWLTRLRYRLEDFRATAVFGHGLPCSVKIRPHAGHFDRASAPRAYARIDRLARKFLSSTVWLGDHDTGPEILCVLTLSDGQHTLGASVAALLQEILLAAREGIAAGDPLDDQVYVLLRGFDMTGAHFDLLVMTRSPGAPPVGSNEIAQTFACLGIGFQERRKGLAPRAPKRPHA